MGSAGVLARATSARGRRRPRGYQEPTEISSAARRFRHEADAPPRDIGRRGATCCDERFELVLAEPLARRGYVRLEHGRRAAVSGIAALDRALGVDHEVDLDHEPVAVARR